MHYGCVTEAVSPPLAMALSAYSKDALPFYMYVCQPILRRVSLHPGLKQFAGAWYLQLADLFLVLLLGMLQQISFLFHFTCCQQN